MTTDTFWEIKLHARLHDPAEKALVLLRDPAGHEGGTCRAMARLMGWETSSTSSHVDPDHLNVLHCTVFKNGLSKKTYETVKRADWWAAAADRPQWPMQEITVQTKAGSTKTFQVADWAQVRWASSPVLIHPLSATQFDLGKSGGLSDTELDDLKARSFDHVESLVQRTGDSIDACRTLLALWRFGPSLREENDNGKLGLLWPLLPADTRVPDHSIWDHLDLTSAFAGAFAADPDGEAALLTVALGPVQSFIEAARSTSDLWAGSHLLARLAWEAMKPVCEELGPDAILFPRLRGVPQVDLWLRDDCGLPEEFFADCEWTQGATDANPLFAAALPNRFVAIVPRAQAQALAQTVERAVRGWLQSQGRIAVDRLLAVAQLKTDSEQHCHRQMREQLEGFPEVHWAAVPFSLARPRNVERQTDLDTSALSAAMAPFFGAQAGEPCGFLDSAAWKVLQKETLWDDKTTFFAPNPGVLYPAIYELAERALAAAKAVRPFAPSTQQGWRCSLTGETEWLTTDPAQLQRSYRQQTDTLWTKVALNKPAWAKSGEHLGALPALKRVWPTLFAEEVGKAIGKNDRADTATTASGAAQRFVVSTHAMALTRQIDQWLERGAVGAEGLAEAIQTHRVEAVALPRRLARKHAAHRALDDAKRFPALLDAAAECDDDAQAQALRKLVRGTLNAGAEKSVSTETYYGLLMMDGDHMGAWLAGSDEHSITYRESFHPRVCDGFTRHAKSNSLLLDYAQQKRALSPNRHLAISGALNDFSLLIARHVVEEEHLGRLIYAGGDDVLAMLPVADLLPAMQRLRVAYAGHDPAHVDGDREGLVLKKGFALLETRKGKRLMRMMGEHATASCGAVVAHHQAPLAAVMRELRLAEQRAKNEGGRNAFSLTIVKRSGGALTLTAKWGEPVRLLTDLQQFLAADGVSRRAVYNSLEWMKDLPTNQPDMLASLLAYQLERQAAPEARKLHAVPALARRLAALAFDPQSRPSAAQPLAWLGHFMSTAEFLARESRSGV